MIKYLFVFILFLLPGIVIAGGTWSHSPPMEVTNVTNLTNISNVDYDELADIVATAAACDASFYFGTSRPQLDVNVAIYNGAEAVCIQGGWKPENSNVLFKVGWVPDEDPDQQLYRFGALVIF